MSAAPIGLIAAWGHFPVHFARKTRALGIPLVTVGLKHLADPELRTLSDQFFWCGLGRMGRALNCFRRTGVRRWVMAGKFPKTILMNPWSWWSLLPDWRALRFWYYLKRRDNRDDTLLLGLIDEFAKYGMECESALTLCPELLVNEGVLTRRGPSATEEKDIAFGWELAKAMGGLDVGQSVAVRDLAVLAVEAIEGTDQAILRAGELCRRNRFVVVKVAKPHQDMRFDVPTVGTRTIETMKQAGAKVLAIEAGRTILLDEPATVALADRYGIAIVALQRAARLKQ